MVELKVGAEELLRSVRMVSELEGGVGLKVFGEALEGILAGWDGEGLELQRRWIEVERYGRELDVSMEAVAEGWSWEGDRNGDVLGDLKRMCNEVDAAYVELQQRIVDLRMECELGEHVLAVETESAERLRSKLAKERHARQEESQKRQKWKTEVGTRLKTSTRLLRDLRKDNAALVDNFEMRSEYRLDWQDRGERARDEIEGLRPRCVLVLKVTSLDPFPGDGIAHRPLASYSTPLSARRKRSRQLKIWKGHRKNALNSLSCLQH